MRLLRFLMALVFGILIVGGTAQKVNLAEVQTLTLHSGQNVVTRSVSPIPQLHCVGGRRDVVVYQR